MGATHSGYSDTYSDTLVLGPALPCFKMVEDGVSQAIPIEG